jgi:alkylhydroperoxidase family enzyme
MDPGESGEKGTSPAWIHTIGPHDAVGPLGDIYAGIAGPSGSVANILRSQSLHPEGLRDHYRLYRTLMHGRGALPRAHREAIGVAVSRANGCHY